MKLVVITHGKTMPGFDPVLSTEGIDQMRKLKAKVFKEFSNLKSFKIIAGIGKRHKQSVCLIVDDTQYSTSEHIGVKLSQSVDGKYIHLSTEEKVPIQELREKMQEIILKTRNFLIQLFPLTENVAIIGGRIIAVASGISIAESKSACIYEIQLIDGKLSIKETFSVD